MATTVHMFDSGVVFMFNVVDESGPVDLSTILGVDVYFQKPDKSILQRTGDIFDAVQGVVTYTSSDTDFDQAGRWKTQLVVRFAGNDVKHSDIGTLTVAVNLT